MKILTEFLINWALSRLSEASTWRGIVLALTSAGMVLKPNQAHFIVAAGLAIVGAINIFRNEKKAADDAADAAVQRVVNPNPVLLSPKDAANQ